MRVLLALGGNALTAQGRARPEDQIAAAEVAMASVADLVHTGQRGASVQWQETRAQAGALQTEVNTLAGSVAQLNKHIRESDG